MSFIEHLFKSKLALETQSLTQFLVWKTLNLRFGLSSSYQRCHSIK